MAERDLLEYLNTEDNQNPSNSQGRDLLSYIQESTETAPQEDLGVSTVGANLYDYDPSQYDYGGIQVSELGNLEGIRAENQGVLDALGRSTANLIGKTGINVVGGTIGTIYGLGSAIASGEVSDIWDNSLTTSLDAASEAVGDTFKVYKSADYEDKSLLGRLVTHPIQFTDEFMDTLSFTTGAIVTELLTAGVASAAIAPRAMKYIKALDKAAEAVNVGRGLATAERLGQLGNAANLTRQLATGAAWEASVEARHGAIELKNNMYNDALQEYGVSDISQLPENVVNDIEDKASNAGLFTFLANMALVGSSNMMQFPKIFGAGYNTSKKAADRIVREAGEYIDTALPTSRTGRITRDVTTALKNPFLEGVVEEGGQGVISGTANTFWDRKNDDESKSNIDQFLTALGTNLKDTYTTGEGWYEIGMGMLIGSLGAPGRGLIPGQRGIDPETGERRELWTGGIAESFQARNQEDREVAELVSKLNQDPTLMESMKANYDFLVTTDNLQKYQDLALDNNDVFAFQNYRDDMLHSYIDSRIKSGMTSDLKDQVQDLKKMNVDDFYTSFRGEEASLETDDSEKQQFKLNSIKELEDRINNTIEAVNLVDSNYKGDNEDIRTELIYNISSAKNIDIRENELNNNISKLSEGFLSNNIIRTSDNENVVNVDYYIKNIQESLEQEESELGKEEFKRVKDTLSKIDKNVKLTPSEFTALSSFVQEKPVAASLYMNTITSMLDDSHKLRQRREAFINLYNDLFTEQGQRKFEKYQRDLEEAKAKEAEEQQKKLEDEEKRKQQESENKAVKKRQQEIKKKAEQSKKADSIQEVDTTEEEADGGLTFTEATLLDDEGNIVEQPTGVEISPSETLSPESDISTPEEVESPVERSLLTPEEEATLNILQSEEEVEANKEINSDGKVVNDTNKSTKQKQLEDLSFKREVGNTIISLNVNYIESVDEEAGTSEIISQTDEEGNLVINQNFDSRLQDPNQFGKGQSVKMVVPTYSQMMEAGMRDDYTQEEYNQELTNIEKIPVAFLDSNNKIIGYLPTTDNVRNRVQEEFRDTEIIKNQKLRTFVLNNRNTEFNVTITAKSSGAPMFVQNNDSIYNRLGNGERLAEGVHIGVYKNNKLMNGLNSVVPANIKLPDDITVDEYFKEGVVYTIIPTADGETSFAFPADIAPVGSQQAETILRMVQLFRANPKFPRDKALITERDNLSSEIDFSNTQQVMSAIENIIYVNNNSSNNMFQIDTKNGKLRLGITTDKVFDLNDVMNNTDVQNKVIYEIAGRFPTIRLANFGQRFNTYELVDGVLQQRRYRNYFDYLNDKSIITTNIQGQPIEGTGRMYFTAQSVIEFSDPVITEESKTRDIPTTSARPTDQNGDPISRTGARLKPKRKTKPDIQDDYDLLNNIDEPTLDQQAENLMRICKS